MRLPRPNALPNDGWDVKDLHFNGHNIHFVHDLTFDDPVPASLDRYPADPPIDLMTSLVRPGASFVDAGAHLGTFALLAAALGARVAAVEANPRQAAFLAASAERNAFPELHVVGAAVSDTSATLAFVPHGPWSHVRLEAEDGTIPGADVIAITIDDLVEELGWTAVDLIKLDIEGWEPRALRGMQRLMSRHDAPLIICESNAPSLAGYGSDTRELARALEAAGYRRYLIDRLRNRTLVPVTADDLQIEAVADYLAVKGPLPALGAWTVAPPDSRADVVNRVVVWCRQHAVHRCHIGSVLQTAAPQLLAEPQIREELRRLRLDPAPEVRRSVRWSLPAWRRFIERSVVVAYRRARIVVHRVREMFA